MASLGVMGDVIKFIIHATYNLRTLKELYSKKLKTVKYSSETMSFLAHMFGH